MPNSLVVFVALAALPVAQSAARSSAPCTSDHDCSLLGACQAGGACACDSGWEGATCACAKLKPLDVALGYQAADDASTWGGRPIQDPASGTWHLFVAQFTRQCPLEYWLHNSVVARATSASGSAGGPYVYAETAFPEFHHNPSIVGPTPDGYYLLFMIGVTNASNIVDCTAAVPPPPPGHHGFSANAGQIDMAWSRSPEGPWQSRTVLKNWDRPAQNQSAWDCYVTNPSAVLSPNGSVALFFSSVPCTPGMFYESLGVAVAPRWGAEFVQSRTPVWKKPGPPRRPAPSTGVGNIEDPFAWQDGRGNWHIIAHSQGQRNVCGSAGYACSVHLFAEAAAGPWTPSLEPVFNNRTALTNGTLVTMVTRQRPQLTFAADGTTPRFMFVGGSFVQTNNGPLKGVEHTFAFEFDNDHVSYE